MQRTINAPQSSFAFDRPRIAEVARRAAVLVVVVAPFIATAVAIVQLWQWAVTWRDLALLVGLYVPISLGVTVGFHRMLTHRSFETPKPIKYLLAFFGCLALQGGPIRWVATHRLHHKEADKPEDPHSSGEGFLWSHLLWNFYRHPQLETAEDLHRFAPDMERDRVLSFMDKYFFPLFLAVGIWWRGELALTAATR